MAKISITTNEGVVKEIIEWPDPDMLEEMIAEGFTREEAIEEYIKELDHPMMLRDIQEEIVPALKKAIREDEDPQGTAEKIAQNEKSVGSGGGFPAGETRIPQRQIIDPR
jgi:hypothetical protein